MTISEALVAFNGRTDDLSPVTVEERRLSHGGFGFVCRTAGRGARATEPFVLLGGSSQDRYSWVRHEPVLMGLGPVTTVDLPGYGGADFLPARYGIDFLADAVHRMLDELGLERVNLLGACFGGAVGLRFAQRHPERLRRLLLVGMTDAIPDEYAGRVPHWARLMDDGRTAEVARDLVDLFMSPAGAGRVRRHAAVSRLLYRQFVERGADRIRMDVEHSTRLMSHDWYVPAPVPPVPALVLTGEYDTLTPPHSGRRTARTLNGAWFTTIKEADHLLPVERSDELSDLIVRFCTDRPISGLPYCNPAEFVPAAAPVD
jgi:pimeloyl-ACP methyl ester carboxylesterase